MAISSSKLTNWYDFQAPFYHFWRDDYDQAVISHLLANLAPDSPPMNVLDAGCGTGLFTIPVARNRPTWKITGIDLSIGMLEVARRQSVKLLLENARFVQGNVTALPASDSTYDVIIAGGLFPNLNDAPAALREFLRVIKRNGRLHVVEVDRSSMSSLAKAFFRTMILGYRILSWLVPRFRFASQWSIESSTIDTSRFLEQAKESGFRVESVQKIPSYVLFELSKPDGA